MCHVKKQKSILLAALLCLPGLMYAVQPLSESDMDDVSAETGRNILDIFGPAAAGLEEDTEISASEKAEDDDTTTIAAQVLEEAEDQIKRQDISSVEPQLSFEEIENALEAGVSVIGSAKVFDTTSEIQYREQDFHHKAEFLADGSVIHERDLYIDLLKLENLRGDDTSSDGSLGSIYLFDWRSQGSTRMQVDR